MSVMTRHARRRGASQPREQDVSASRRRCGRAAIDGSSASEPMSHRGYTWETLPTSRRILCPLDLNLVRHHRWRGRYDSSRAVLVVWDRVDDLARSIRPASGRAGFGDAGASGSGSSNHRKATRPSAGSASHNSRGRSGAGRSAAVRLTWRATRAAVARNAQRRRSGAAARLPGDVSPCHSRRGRETLGGMKVRCSPPVAPRARSSTRVSPSNEQLRRRRRD